MASAPRYGIRNGSICRMNILPLLIPINDAASAGPSLLRTITRALHSLAILGILPIDSAAISFTIPGPERAFRNKASSIGGRDFIVSESIRNGVLSVLAPEKANARMMPRINEIIDTGRAIENETRTPYPIRPARSRPSVSVPAICCREGD